ANELTSLHRDMVGIHAYYAFYNDPGLYTHVEILGSLASAARADHTMALARKLADSLIPANIFANDPSTAEVKEPPDRRATLLEFKLHHPGRGTLPNIQEGQKIEIPRYLGERHGKSDKAVEIMFWRGIEYLKKHNVPPIFWENIPEPDVDLSRTGPSGPKFFRTPPIQDEGLRKLEEY